MSNRTDLGDGLAIKEFGDFQTPLDFTQQICRTIARKLEHNPDIIIEPTFGIGNFIIASIGEFKSIKKIFGIEINKNYYEHTLNRIQNLSGSGFKIDLFNEDFFRFDFNKITTFLDNKDKLLLIGNPPWVTNSDLGNIDSKNVPKKHNYKKFSGLDAMTGKGNFDIAEYIITTTIKQFSQYDLTVAFLCKTIIVQNLLKAYDKLPFTFSKMEIYRFDSEKVFGANCDSCLFFAKIGTPASKICDVYNLDSGFQKISSFGWVDNKFISNIDSYSKIKNIDGTSPFEWRQGIKHDCSKVMELIRINEKTFSNGLKEEIALESDPIFPFLKSSDLKESIIKEVRKYTIITQAKIKQDTSYIKEKYPLLWDYLMNHEPSFSARKSSIYRNSPPFSIFGIGDYSFMPYKVAISGFYKDPRFCLIKPIENKPVMLDDTCYFLGFDNEQMACIVMLVLNSEMVKEFLKSVTFIDSKRPYTKDILMRIDIAECIRQMEFSQIQELAKQYAPDECIDEKGFIQLKKHILKAKTPFL